jgi:hypothetical protein
VLSKMSVKIATSSFSLLLKKYMHDASFIASYGQYIFIPLSKLVGLFIYFFTFNFR